MNLDGVAEISCPLGKFWRAYGITDSTVIAETVTVDEAKAARRFYMAGYDAATAAHVRAMAERRTEAAAVVEQVAQAAVAAERAAQAASRAAAIAAVEDGDESPPRNELSLVSYTAPLPLSSSKALVVAKKRAPRGSRTPKNTASAALSAHPARLGVQNGVLSFGEGGLKLLPTDTTLAMRAGRLGPFDPVPYIPWSSLVEEDATTQLMDFLRSLFPDPDVLEYVLCAVASCLDGVRRVPNLFLCHGTGSNGKSAFQTLVSLTLGDYATTLQGEMLCKKTTTEQFNKVIQHRRWLAVGEPVLGTALHAATVATLLESSAAHVFLFTCELPVLKTDDAGWSRVRVLPFETRFHHGDGDSLVGSTTTKPADLHLQRKLPTWRKAFLSLLIDRFHSAVREARAEPAKVRDATVLYRVRNDPFQQFVRESFVVDEGALPLDAAALRYVARQWRALPPGGTRDVKDSEILTRLAGVRGLRPRWREPVAGFILDTGSLD